MIDEIKPGKRYTKIITAITTATPITPASAVTCKASAPYEADTTLLDSSVNLTGKEPELIRFASVLAESSVKLPEIMQSPLISDCTEAAEIYLGSSPFFAFAASAAYVSPSCQSSHTIMIFAPLPFCAIAFVIAANFSLSAIFKDTIGSPSLYARDAPPSCKIDESANSLLSTSRNVRFAVVPINSRAVSRSFAPAICTRTRLLPSTVICGSLTPNTLIRFEILLITADISTVAPSFNGST